MSRNNAAEIWQTVNTPHTSLFVNFENNQETENQPNYRNKNKNKNKNKTKKKKQKIKN